MVLTALREQGVKEQLEAGKLVEVVAVGASLVEEQD
jgi:hypothetical protein